MTRVIPLESLRGACPKQLQIVRHEWPRGIPVTMASARRAIELGLDIGWAANTLLTAQEMEAFLKATAPAREAYKKATAPAWEAHVKARTPAWEAFLKATAPAREAYKKATATALVKILKARKQKRRAKCTK